MGAVGSLSELVNLQATEESGMTLQEALYELGMRDDTLSQAEKAHLDREGYVLLPNILSAAQIASICRAMAAVYAAEGTGQKDGPAEASYMQNKVAGLDLCFTHPRVLAAICHVLDGTIKSFGVHGRPHPPGGEQQALHVDYNGPAPQADCYAVCNSLWMLTEFTPENGATRVIPGTQRSGQDPKEALDDPVADHLRQKLLLGEAGTVAVFNSHSGTAPPATAVLAVVSASPASFAAATIRTWFFPVLSARQPLSACVRRPAVYSPTQSRGRANEIPYRVENLCIVTVR